MLGVVVAEAAWTPARQLYERKTKRSAGTSRRVPRMGFVVGHLTVVVGGLIVVAQKLLRVHLNTLAWESRRGYDGGHTSEISNGRENQST